MTNRESVIFTFLKQNLKEMIVGSGWTTMTCRKSHIKCVDRHTTDKKAAHCWHSSFLPLFVAADYFYFHLLAYTLWQLNTNHNLKKHPLHLYMPCIYIVNLSTVFQLPACFLASECGFWYGILSLCPGWQRADKMHDPCMSAWILNSSAKAKLNCT